MSKEELLQAYSETDYIIPDLGIIVKIGQENKELDALQEKYASCSWAFITAENPKSKSLSDDENQQRTNQLKVLIEKLGKPYFEGYGQGKSGWKPEKSFLILDTSRNDAIEKFGIPFEQNAIVVGEKSKEAVLCIVEDIFN